MRAAVVGHVEWIWFLRVDAVPKSGEIATARDSFELAAGGAGVAAAQMARLTNDTFLFTAFGDDQYGHAAAEQLSSMGIHLEATFEPRVQRRGVTFLDARGERTITVVGDRLDPCGDAPLAWDALSSCDAVYMCAGDVGAIRAARAARVVVATARILPRLRDAGIKIDALVGSLNDPAELFTGDELQVPPALCVQTDGARGGLWWHPGEEPERYRPQTPGRIVDTYGAGDSFAAGLAFALGSGIATEEAIALAAKCGAAVTSGLGPYSTQLRLPD